MMRCNNHYKNRQNRVYIIMVKWRDKNGYENN